MSGCDASAGKMRLAPQVAQGGRRSHGQIGVGGGGTPGTLSMSHCRSIIADCRLLQSPGIPAVNRSNGPRLLTQNRSTSLCQSTPVKNPSVSRSRRRLQVPAWDADLAARCLWMDCHCRRPGHTRRILWHHNSALSNTDAQLRPPKQSCSPTVRW